jgi:hypothetical protein
MWAHSSDPGENDGSNATTDDLHVDGINRVEIVKSDERIMKAVFGFLIEVLRVVLLDLLLKPFIFVFICTLPVEWILEKALQIN